MFLPTTLFGNGSGEGWLDAHRDIAGSPQRTSVASRPPRAAGGMVPPYAYAHPDIAPHLVVPGNTWNMQFGKWGEALVRDAFRFHYPNWQVVPGNLQANGNGIDLIAILRDASGKITRLEFGEIKARTNFPAADLTQAGSQLTDKAIERGIGNLRLTNPELAEEVSQFMKQSPQSCQRAVYAIESVTMKLTPYVQKGSKFVATAEVNIRKMLAEVAGRTNNPETRRIVEGSLEAAEGIIKEARVRFPKPVNHLPAEFPALADDIATAVVTAEEAAVGTRAGTVVVAEEVAGVKAGAVVAEEVAGVKAGAVVIEGTAVGTKAITTAIKGTAAGTEAVATTEVTVVGTRAVVAAAEATGAVGVGVGEGLAAGVGMVALPVGVAVDVYGRANTAIATETRFKNRDISNNERIASHAGNAAGMAGGWGGAYGGAQLGAAGGAMGGAAIGSVVPIVGTAIGGAVGGFVGGVGGAIGGYFGGSFVAHRATTATVRAFR
jgi:hypothetical protein